MTANGVRVRGLNRTIRELTKLGVEASELKESMSRIGDKAVQEAKALAPVGASSALVNSIRGNKAKAKVVVRAGSKKVYYASFNEWGTSRITGKEFVTKAVQNNRSYAVQQIEVELKKIIARNHLK